MFVWPSYSKYCKLGEREEEEAEVREEALSMISKVIGDKQRLRLRITAIEASDRYENNMEAYFLSNQTKKRRKKLLFVNNEIFRLHAPFPLCECGSNSSKWLVK